MKQTILSFSLVKQLNTDYPVNGLLLLISYGYIAKIPVSFFKGKYNHVFIHLP